MPKRWLEEVRDYDFEGRKFLGISEYDGRLRWNYGNYMELPPKKDRVSHILASSFKADI